MDLLLYFTSHDKSAIEIHFIVLVKAATTTFENRKFWSHLRIIILIVCGSRRDGFW